MFPTLFRQKGKILDRKRIATWRVLRSLPAAHFWEGCASPPKHVSFSPVFREAQHQLSKWSLWQQFLDVIHQKYIEMSYWIDYIQCDKIVNAGNYKALQLHCFHVLPFCWNTKLLMQFFHRIYLNPGFRIWVQKIRMEMGWKTTNFLVIRQKGLWCSLAAWVRVLGNNLLQFGPLTSVVPQLSCTHFSIGSGEERFASDDIYRQVDLLTWNLQVESLLNVPQMSTRTIPRLHWKMSLSSMAWIPQVLNHQEHMEWSRHFGW